MNTDNYQPSGKWDFDEGVTDVFDNMLERSIPQYHVMRDACLDIAKRFRQPQADIVDLGCSNGSALDPFVRKYGATNRYLGLDVSEPMLAAARERFAGYIETGIVRIEKIDLRESYPRDVASCVTLCVLALQFTPIEYRLRILDDIYRSTVSGGALILVEKVLGANNPINQMMVDTYYEMKERNGYSREDIDRKRFALEGVLVPVTAKWNEELLKLSGFRSVDCFWRWMNFAGWVAVK